MEFKVIGRAVNEKFTALSKEETLYRVDVDKDEIWDIYLKSYPEGTNPIYKEKTEHDCNCCKNFIRDVGDVVTIKDGKLQTIWDVEIEGYYGEVASRVSEFVKKQGIKNIFQHYQQTAGSEITRQQSEDGSVKSWNHFYCDIPQRFVNKGASNLNDAKTTVQVFERGLKEISLETIEIVQELIDQGLYRGDEFKGVVKQFKTLKVKYDSIENELEINLFLWENFKSHGARIRNTVIGTLLQDISEGVELDKSVSSFESKVAPANFKRPTAIITQGQKDQAMTTIAELGIEPSIYRRFAKPGDVSVNNVLFTDRSITPLMKGSIDDILSSEVKSKKDYSKVDEITIDDFVQNILPNTTSIEVLLQNKHTGNLMSLIAPKNIDAPNILKWDNNFSWSYNGNVTDSMKERVKAKGGNIDAELRFSIQWNEENDNPDDLDAHCKEPCGNLISYPKKAIMQKSSGMLDVDIINPANRVAVENITHISRDKMPKGDYEFSVNCYSSRGARSGFDSQIEFDGIIHEFSYGKELKQDQKVKVANVNWDGNKFTIKPFLESSASSKTVWGVSTEKFHKVNILTISPNHWDNQSIGNKHYFFILDNCLNDDPPRGFYNEFLQSDLDKHRKVFEVIGSKTKCELSDEQLSGVGFSTTKRDHIICKVSGSFNRTLKVTF